MESAKILASCLCGDVRWEVETPFNFMIHCHCSRCRKVHGAAYSTYVGVPEERFRFVSGADNVARYESMPGNFRPFCKRCGSVVPDGVPWRGRVAMPAGPFDGDPGERPQSHIFVADEVPWYSIDDGLPRYDAYPPGVDAPTTATRAPLDPPDGHARGSCLCGGVTYVVMGDIIRARTCHCSRCRKAGSSTHVTYMVTGYDGVRFTRGAELLVTYKMPEARFFKKVFCGVCGSNMPRSDAERGISIVPMGSLDDDPGVRPGAHIFVGSKAAWDTITDGLPQWGELPPS